MNYPTPPLLKRESDVREKLAQQSRPLLLNFTADWCQPCKAFAPVLGALHGKHGGLIDVTRVDIDACPELARQYGIRSVPTSILLRDGKEHDRFAGAKPEHALVQWLVARDIALLETCQDDNISTSFGAFYGDDSLRQFLVERLCLHMDQGDVQTALFPFWADGKGSVSCALVHHPSPEVFECISGLPYAFACALEFLKLERRSDAEAVFRALTPGRDVGDAPLRMMHAWFAEEALGWTGALGSASHDTLRRDWLSLTEALLDGVAVPAQHWTALRDTARQLATTNNDPYHQLEDDLVELVTLLSPPADVRDSVAWSQVLGRTSFAMMRLTEYAAGWTRENSAKPVLREQFFRKHIPINADGSYDQQLFEARRAEWERDNADFVMLDNAYDISRRHRHWIALHAQFRPTFVAILSGI